MIIKMTLFEKYDHLRQETGRAPIVEAAEYQRAVKRPEGQTEFIMSTGGIKRDGFEIVQAGWRFQRFLDMNPLAPWRHSTASPEDAMGTWPKVWKSRDSQLDLHLRGLLKWNTKEQNPKAAQVQLCYDQGVMRACSVRWEEADAEAVEEIKPEELKGLNVDRMAKMYGAIRFLRSDLIECSPCMLGMDKDALSVRMRGGTLPQNFIDMCVTVPGDASDGTIDDRYLLRLDGHPLGGEVDRPLISIPAVSTDTAAQAVADAAIARVQDSDSVPNPPAQPVAEVGAAMEAEAALAPWRAYVASGDPRRAAQRFQRRLCDVPAAHHDAIRAVITDALVKAKAIVPWDTPTGRAYELLHHQYLQSTSERERGVMQKAIVEIATACFGAERLREIWEQRAYPEGPESVWVSVERILEAALVDVVVDPEERDARIDTLLGQLGEQLAAPLARRNLEPAFALIARQAGQDPGGNLDVIVNAILLKFRAPIIPEEPAEPVPDQSLAVLAERLARSPLIARGAAPAPVAPVMDLTERINSLFERVTKPRAGASSGT